jgi:hypothetical protein
VRNSDVLLQRQRRAARGLAEVIVAHRAAVPRRGGLDDGGAAAIAAIAARVTAISVPVEAVAARAGDAGELAVGVVGFLSVDPAVAVRVEVRHYEGATAGGVAQFGEQDRDACAFQPVAGARPRCAAHVVAGAVARLRKHGGSGRGNHQYAKGSACEIPGHCELSVVFDGRSFARVCLNAP